MAEGLNSLGKRVARRFIVRGVRPKPSELARELGVEVIFEPAPPPAQPGLRSEYRSDPPRIILYTESIDRVAIAIHLSQRFDMMACDPVEVHIAHELFHHLEFGGRFGRLTREEAEAAADDFARELLGLEFDPRELPSGAE